MGPSKRYAAKSSPLRSIKIIYEAKRSSDIIQPVLERDRIDFFWIEASRCTSRDVLLMNISAL